jgi:DNA primase
MDPLEAGELRIERAGDYLDARGISLATARHWRLGWAGRGTGHGLPCRPLDEHQRTTDLYLESAALLIPWYRDRKVESLKIRWLDSVFRFNPKSRKNEQERYTSLWDSRPVLFGDHTLQGRRVAILCEGELDAILLWQHVGDIVGVVTFGSCRAEPPVGAIPALLPLSRVLVAYDVDNAGENAATTLLHTAPQRLFRLRPPVPIGKGKDITDAWRAGADLRQWVVDGLRDIGLEVPV